MRSVQFLEHWLEPSLENGFVEHLNFAGGTKWVLAIISIIAAGAGIWFARQVYLRNKFSAKKIELTFFKRAWYIDDGLTAFVGGKGKDIFQAAADFDSKVVDGAVMGVAHSTRGLGGLLRRIQTGKVRTYALWIVLGVIGFLVYFLIRAGI